MICHRQDLIASFCSYDNLTFVYFNNLRLKYHMDVYFDLKQITSIDNLVSEQAENNKNNRTLLFSSTLSLCVSLLTLA